MGSVMEEFQVVWTLVALAVVVLMVVALMVVALTVVALLYIAIAIVQYHKWVKRKAGVVFGLIF